MAGLIKNHVIEDIKDRLDIKEVVEQFVTLRSAGTQSFKGLCPFHDERTPSFTVNTGRKFYHCFGCGASGDAISFLQQMEQLSFVEAVEKLAEQYQVELVYEEGAGPDAQQRSIRKELAGAQQAAEQFFRQQLNSPEAAPARAFLQERGFDAQAAEYFGLGYAPKGWDNLMKALRGQNFSQEVLSASGLFSEGQRGIYDRFRGRLIWPIRNIVGETIGFGARKLYEDDPGPKYLNTPETPLYKKSEVLYGLDLAKRSIAKEHSVILVEGYTDVMAAHLAGLTTAVATCGTAFGAGHINILRRLLADDSQAQVIFTFDGDAAGQKAALRAFSEDHRFLAQTFVAIEPHGLDPCELRQERGDEAVRSLIEHRIPLFEFAIKAALANHNLNTVEGRVAGLRAAAPIVAGLKDRVLRETYVRELAGWLGMEVEWVQREIAAAAHQQPSPGAEARATTAPPQGQAPLLAAQQDPVSLLEAEALAVVIQHPEQLSAEQYRGFYQVQFRVPALETIHSGVISAIYANAPQHQWVESICAEVPTELTPLVTELAMRQLPVSSEEHLPAYCRSIINRLLEVSIMRQRSELLGRLQRVQNDDETTAQIQQQLMDLEQRRRKLRAEL